MGLWGGVAEVTFHKCQLLILKRGWCLWEIQSFREAAIRWPRGDTAPDFRERGLSAFQQSDVTASHPSPLGLGQAWRLPRKGQQKATVSHALDLSARSWERMRRKRCQQGAGLPARRDVPAKPGIQSRPREPGASCSLLFCSARVTVGLGRAREAGADTPAQSWQGQRPQLSLGYTGTHMIQVTTSCYAYLTLQPHPNWGLLPKDGDEH